MNYIILRKRVFHGKLAKYILLIFFKHFGRCNFQNHISGLEMNLNVRKAQKAAEVVYTTERLVKLRKMFRN